MTGVRPVHGYINRATYKTFGTRYQRKTPATNPGLMRLTVNGDGLLTGRERMFLLNVIVNERLEQLPYIPQNGKAKTGIRSGQDCNGKTGKMLPGC